MKIVLYKIKNVKIVIEKLNLLTIIFNMRKDIEIIEIDRSKFDELIELSVKGKVKNDNKVKGLVK